jgi:RNA methyltransferase, TrmH family
MGFNQRIIDITSSTNPAIKVWKSLLGSRGIKKHGLTIVSGSRIIEDILQNRPDIIDACLIHGRDMHEIPNLTLNIKIYRLESALFRELDTFGTGFPLLVVKVPDIPKYDKTCKTPPLLLLVPFQDPSNVGAVVRSAVAFDLTTIMLLEEAASPYHPKSIRASGGYVFAASFVRGPSIKLVDIQNIPVIGLSSSGIPLSSFRFPEQCALLPGIEGPGLPDAPWLSDKVAIPISPRVESLNAAVATAIALYAWHEKRTKNK